MAIGSKNIVCRRILTDECAAKAARRLGRPVAWIAPWGPWRFYGLSGGKSAAIEALYTNEGSEIFLVSGEELVVERDQLLIETNHINGIEVRVYEFKIEEFPLPSYTLAWTRDGTPYYLEASPPFGLFPNPDAGPTRNEVITMFRRMRYAEP